MKYKQKNSVQQWLPYKKVLANGMIQLKDNSLTKILIISPINFNLKSNLEKEAILNSYKTFLKTCNFNLQILIQSKKEDLSKHISNVENINKNEKDELLILSEKYTNFIQSINQEKKSSSKNFYILIREFPKNKKQELELGEEKILCEKLNDCYFKIKECLTKCGNQVIDSDNRETSEKILYSSLNTRKALNNF